MDSSHGDDVLYKRQSTCTSASAFLKTVQRAAIVVDLFVDLLLQFYLKNRTLETLLTMKLTIFVLLSVMTLVSCSIPEVFLKSVEGKGQNCYCREKQCTDTSCEEKNCICLVVSVDRCSDFRKTKNDVNNFMLIMAILLTIFSESPQKT